MRRMSAGEIDEVSNQRAWIGAFPLRGIEMESAMCRIVAMLPQGIVAARGHEPCLWPQVAEEPAAPDSR